MSRVNVLEMSGNAYGPVQIASTNANQTLPTNIVTNDSRNALRVVVSCEDNAIRYAFGGVIPVAGANGHVLAANEILTIGHPGSIESFRFVSAVANSHANLQITGEYGTL